MEHQELARARAYCARQERCHQEVRNKLYAWGVHGTAVEETIGTLIGEGYLNEARFAEHFAVSKLRQKGWGLRKIQAALEQKRISEPCIRQALNGIEDEEYLDRLQALVNKSWSRSKESDLRIRRQKLFRYLLRKGYASEHIERALSKVPGR